MEKQASKTKMLNTKKLNEEWLQLSAFLSSREMSYRECLVLLDYGREVLWAHLMQIHSQVKVQQKKASIPDEEKTK